MSLPSGSDRQWPCALAIPWALPPWGPELLLTHSVPATLPPHRRVLCQVPACRWHESLKCASADQLLAARLHVLLRRPGLIAPCWSPTNNNHNCISLGRAMGLCVIAVGVRPTIIATALHKSTKRCRISCVRSTNIRTRHSRTTLP